MGTTAEIGDGTMSELGLLDTAGILRQGWVAPYWTSSGLGWEHAYLSTQRETPYHSTFDGAPHGSAILHQLPATVRRRSGRSMRAQRIRRGNSRRPGRPRAGCRTPGGLDTVHLYLSDSALQEAHGGREAVELAEELGSSDPRSSRSC